MAAALLIGCGNPNAEQADARGDGGLDTAGSDGGPIDAADVRGDTAIASDARDVAPDAVDRAMGVPDAATHAPDTSLDAVTNDDGADVHLDSVSRSNER